MTKKLGTVQRQVLYHLACSPHGTWHRNTGWTWEGYGTMVRILNSLARHGLVEKFEHERHPVAFRITKQGKDVFDKAA